MEVPDLVVEEYKAKWEYIRHTEDMRERILTWYLVILGGILSMLFRDFDSLDKAIRRPGAYVPILFLAIYSTLLQLFLLYQKRGYKWYTDRIMALEKRYCAYEAPVPSERFLTTFRLRYGSVTLLGAGLIFLFLFILDLWFAWAAVGAASYFLLFMALSYLPKFRH